MTLYNDRKWRRVRKAFLEANPICVMCQRMGRVEPAAVVDHIVPHKGDLKLFWDESNFQPLCAHCHSSLKKFEEFGKSTHDTACDINGFPLDGKHGWSGKENRRPTQDKYVLVYGPPASGKTTYVKKHMKRGDIVVDFDLLTSALTMLEPHDCPESLLTFFWAVRDNIYRTIVSHSDTINRVWIIHGGAKKAQRDKIEALFGNMGKIMIKASYNQCLLNAKRDKSRKKNQETLIKQWFSDYES